MRSLIRERLGSADALIYASGRIVAVTRKGFEFLGLAWRRDLLEERHRLRRAEEDMRYAKSVNAKLGTRNDMLVKRNSYLELRNSQLEARNRELEARNPHLEEENVRLKQQNHWLLISANAVRKSAHAPIIRKEQLYSSERLDTASYRADHASPAARSRPLNSN
jgi:hypothetical protein